MRLYLVPSPAVKASRSRRLSRVYLMATPEELERGRSWYEVARAYVCKLSEEFNTPHEVAAGVLAVLSPNCTWEQNKGDARRVLSFVALELPWYDCKVSTYNANKVKAFAIAQGAPVRDYVKGPKVSAFFANILGDTTLPTVDSHALNAYVGFRVAFSNSPTPSEVLVRECTRAYLAAAKRHGEAASTFQAIVWCVWKRLVDSGMVPGYIRIKGTGHDET